MKEIELKESFFPFPSPLNNTQFCLPSFSKAIPMLKIKRGKGHVDLNMIRIFHLSIVSLLF